MSLWASVCVVEGKQLGNKEERVLAAEYSQQSRQRPCGAHTPTHYTEKTSRVTCVTLVLWVGNETLRWTLRERPLRTESENPYRITPIHWLMARRRLWRNDVVRSYWRTRHPLLRFLCRKESCRQREELGSKRSVSFPTQRTRVTQVTRDVLFHR